jgi:GNAT superfamily N-acetyltransferase
MSAPDLWRLFGRHAATMFRSGPAPRLSQRPDSFVVMSGAPHVDLNQGALFAGAAAADVEAIAAATGAAGVPSLIAVSASLRRPAPVVEALREAGFLPTAIPEALFHASEPPPRHGSIFDVRRAETSADRAALPQIFAETHRYEPATLSMYERAVADADDLEAWLAWEGDDPAAAVYVTHVDGSLGVFDMATVPRHRRRGAGRALLTTALDDASRRTGRREVVLWSSPAGRPLYESLGFRVADEVNAWTRGATAEDLAAVGAG